MQITSHQKTNIDFIQIRPYLVLFLFFLSGFSGLIYESIWTHYLKLILGHSAYAQTLVLVIFMGGLAIGAYIASRVIHRLSNALLLYAIVEAIIGIAALFFHDVFLLVNGFLFNTAAVSLDSTLAFQILKWLLAGLLILPQSILLGTTFPLISTGLLQISDSHSSGKVFSLLYFNNSFGAAIGVLVSGFYLIQHYGLPGTIATGGWINLFVAISILLVLKPGNVVAISIFKHQDKEAITKDRLYLLMIAVAFFTGMASFFYEIAWIRMLTLVLGGTTHSFELMISAFILGIALGSYWIKSRIETISNPVTALGYIQVLMALCALLTLTFYSSLYDFMAYLLKIIERKTESYSVFMFINHLLVFAVMLPATFFAGMTLPLITNILFKKSNNNIVIGQVYAINTLGSIIGIYLATNILLPLIEVKGLLGLGALTDIAIGIIIFSFLFLKKSIIKFAALSLVSVLAFNLIYQSSDISPQNTSTGVFRTGVARWTDDTQILFHKDGKLSTVDIIKIPSGATVLSNNGKPDASINISKNIPANDEITMVMLAALPISIKPDIKTVANIGMGSGQTTQTLLLYDTIERIDTIEIEESVIQALPYFKQFASKVTADKRSHVHINDARSFFASSKQNFDLIISEPSNPWVSGVASLFTSEFYQQAKKSLNNDGLFVQWLQMYEINIDVLSRIFSALDKNFTNYQVYLSDDVNLFIVASDKEKIPVPKDTIFDSPSAKNMLKRVGLKTVDDIKARYIGDKNFLQPLLKQYSYEYTSDYYPVIEYQAAKSLFLQEDATDIISLLNYTLPIQKQLQGLYSEGSRTVTRYPLFQYSINTQIAQQIYADFVNKGLFNSNLYNNELRHELLLLYNFFYNCHDQYLNEQDLTNFVHKLVTYTAPYLGKTDFNALLTTIERSPCYKNMPVAIHDLMTLYKANSLEDYEAAFHLSNNIYKQHSRELPRWINEYLLASAMLASYKTGIELNSQPFLAAYLQSYPNNQLPLSLRLLINKLEKR